MKKMLFSLRMSAAALLVLTAPLAMAQESVKCPEYPKEEWRTEAELQTKLTQEGWKVRRIEAGCSCMQVYGTTPEGQRVEAFFDPKTFQQVKED